MGKRASVEMSEGFLSANRTRMDAIGPWEVISDPFNLKVLWRKPPVLQGLWVPLNLAFCMDSESNPLILDPDERMFSLWEQFLAGRDELLTQVRNEAAALENEWGPVERGRVEVYRGGGVTLDGSDLYTLQVWFRYAESEEHEFFCPYDPDAGRFGRLEG